MDDHKFAIPVIQKKKSDRKRFMELNFLLRTYQKGCDCTLAKGLKYTNPFYGNVYDKIQYGSMKFYESSFIIQNEAFKMHDVDLEGYRTLINRYKPALYASELIKTTNQSIGCVYTMIVKLRKDDKEYEYIRKHQISEAGEILLEMIITDYEKFDTLHFCHYLTANNLSSKRLYSIEIGEATLSIERNVLLHLKKYKKSRRS